MKVSTILFPIAGEKVYLSMKKIGFGSGFLNGYGGKQEAGETIEQTAERETKEECGIVVYPESLEKVAIIEFFEESTPIFECHIFFCGQWDGDFVETEEMGLAHAFDRDAMPYEQMWHADRVWLPLLFAGNKIHAKSVYNKGMTEQIDFSYTDL